MKLFILLISIILSIKYVSANDALGYGIWNGEENNIIIGKLNLSPSSSSYSTIFMLENNTLVNSNDNPLSTYNRKTNTIYFFTNDINNNENGYLYSFNFNTNEINMVIQYQKKDYQFYAIESDHSTTDLDLFIVYKDNNYKTNSYYCGGLSKLYGVPALYDPINGEFLSATYNTDKETFDVLSFKDNQVTLSSYILFGINVKRQPLKSPIDASSTSLLSYSQRDSSIYGTIMNKGNQQIIKINGNNIALLNWMDNNNSKLIKEIVAMNIQDLNIYQSVIYFDNTYGINLLNNNGIITSIKTPFLLNNYWFI